MTELAERRSGRNTRSERVARRRRQILEAAVELMQERGFHSVSMQSLADRADLSVGLIYQYFGNKDDVLRAVIVDILEDFRDHVPAALREAGDDPVDRISVALGAFCRIIDEKRDAALLSYRESKTLTRPGQDQVKFLEIQTTEPIRQAVRDGVDSGALRPVNPEIVVHNVLMVAHGWALKHWRLAPMMSLDEYIEAETDLLLAAIVAE